MTDSTKVCKDRICITQSGFLPNDRKSAVLTFYAESFCVKTADGRERFRGKTEHFGFDRLSGDTVCIADFSDFDEIGEYYVEAAEACSEFFTIGDGVYSKPLALTSKAFYYLRCGCGLDEKYAGVYRHAPCHTSDAALWEDRNVYIGATGGWHDAGDYGRYVTAGSVALAHLLYSYILYPNTVKKLSLNIPESEGYLPDILAECKYELDWLLKMQRQDGAVYHKLTTAAHAPFVMPENDKSQLYLLPVSSMASADFAAVCALASRVLKEYSIEYSVKLLAAAEKTYKWLETHREFIPFENPEGCTTGGYGERTDADNRFWAACEMYAATADEKYYSDVLRYADSIPLTELGYASVGGLGALAYLTCNRGRGYDSLAEKLSDSFLKKAEALKTTADSCGYGAAMDENSYCWGSNMNLMKHGMIFAIADTVLDKSEYREYAKLQAEVLLGRNALGISYITGIGAYRCNRPHLRPSSADGIVECIPGMVAGGPNRHPGDAAAKEAISEGTPPMKCYADIEEAYSLNEITIYWNSPAVFVFAYLEELRQ